MSRRKGLSARQAESLRRMTLVAWHFMPAAALRGMIVAVFFADGLTSHGDGLPRQANPHRAGSEAAREWFAGSDEGAAKKFAEKRLESDLSALA
jgi:hypothetical protein